MADDDAESIGGISVSIGASHAKLVSDLAQADRLLEAWAKRQVNIAIGATFAGGTGGGGAGASAAPKVRYGAAATTGIQSQQGQSSLQAAINAQLAKTGEHYDAVTGEVTKATSAIKGQRTAIIGVQEAAARPTALNIDTAALQNDLNAVLGTLREIVTTAQSIGSLPAARIGVGGAGAVSGGSVTTHERASNTDLATRIGRAVSTNRRAAGAGLGALSAEAEAANGGARTSATFLPPLSQAGQAALAARGSLPPSGQRGSTFATSGAIPIADDNELGGAGRLRAVNEADIERRAQAQVARATAQAVSAARTSRTQASGLGGIFGGGVTRERIQATAALGEAEQKLTIAHRRVADFEQKGVTTGRAYAAAREEQTVAENEYGSALGRVEKLASPLSGARNLLAITAAGAAFSLGLKAVDFGLAVTEKAFSNVFDIASGYGAQTTKVTGALAAQTAALHGNSAEAVANAEAQAGISTAAAQNLNPQLQLTTQVKAGAQAATSQQDLIRAALGAGGAPQGLLGGYGGVLNGPFLAQQLGGGKGFAETIKDTFGDLTHPVTGIRPGLTLGPLSALGLGGGPVLLPNPAANGPQRAALETGLNDAAKRGATALGLTSDQIVRFGRITDGEATQIAQSNLPQELKDLAANSGEGLRDAFGNLITASDAATKALEQVAVGQGIAPADQIGRANLAAEQERQREAAASLPAILSQQAHVEPSQIAAIGRQSGYARGAQLPAGLGLQGLAQPLIPVTANIAPQDVGGASKGIGEAQAAQDELNAKYKEGQQIIENTYRPSLVQAFGEAAGVAFDTALAAVTSTGSQIAGIQTKIAKAQTGYETAQYNFQLIIAKRNLSDIGGLINKNLGAGESYYGQLERQNLLLGRQGQLLQFGLSQRQINFQTAVAGFQAPGLTDEERQARIAEAKIEASYAQKQLDIQKQQFKNQVKLIDIGNLRQASDLWNQTFGPSGLVAGHALQVKVRLLDTTAKDLQQIQAQNVAVLNSYLGQVDQAVGIKFGQMQALEAAYGKIIFKITNDTLTGVGNYLGALTTEINTYAASIGGSAGITGGKNSTLPKATATGGVFGLNQPTRIGSDRIAGEAGNETLIVLAHPRSAGISGGGGAGSLTINFNAPIGVRSNDDIRSIARAVEDIFNAKAARLGLRSLSSATS